jgi:hypothetical protein
MGIGLIALIRFPFEERSEPPLLVVVCRGVVVNQATPPFLDDWP